MLTSDQLRILRNIDSSLAFDDESSVVVDLVLEGYVRKDGDLFQLTAKGEKVVLDSGLASSLEPEAGPLALTPEEPKT
jgi:hypothetical protein